MLGVTSASSPIRSRTRRLTANSTSIVPRRCSERDAACPASDASQPQKALPSAMARLYGDQVHRDRAGPHPGRRGSLGSRGQTGKDARPGRAGAERPEERDRRVARRGDEQRAGDPQQHEEA